MLEKLLEHYGCDTSRCNAHRWSPVKCFAHDDRTASASVHLEKGGYICHACGVKGDAIKLIMTQEGLGYSDAIGFAERVLQARIPDLRRPARGRDDTPRQPSRWRHRLFG